MSYNKEKLLPALAITVLIIGIFSTIYVNANSLTNDVSYNSILINNQSYDLDKIFSDISSKTIDTDEGVKTGIGLDEIIIYTSETCPNCYQYTIIGSDGYQQTVGWDDLQKGILISTKSVIFPNLAHSFWVNDVIKIEVK